MSKALLSGSAKHDIQTVEIEMDGLSCSLTGPRLMGEFKDRLFCLFISIKNRKFTRDYINWFVGVCDRNNYRGLICAVDEPYLYNRMAELGVDILPEDETRKIYRLSKEVTRKAEKVVRGTLSKNVSLSEWAIISHSTPAWMKEETFVAYQQKGAFWAHIRNHISLIKNNVDDASLDRYARFFLCELPVLVYSYYRLESGVVDVYPGPNADIFQMIEQGVFEDELPRMTAYAHSGCPLAYLDTSHQ